MSNKYIILSEKKLHKEIYLSVQNKFTDCQWLLINNKFDFNIDILKDFNPTKIFIPHWSYIIPEEIFSAYDCIVFHMTDLPFGRGGSPLQNLIVRGFNSTVISALKVKQGIDTGDIYIKNHLDLSGSASQIFARASLVIEEMIIEIIKSNISPYPQIGEVTHFNRRKPSDSNIQNINELNEMYDFIRMLDCDGYPHAFINTSYFRFEFRNARLDINDKIITANVRIIKK